MRTLSAKHVRSGCLAIVSVAALTFVSIAPVSVAAQTTTRRAASASGAKTFATAQGAADALVAAARTFDVGAIEQIFGPSGDNVVLSGESAYDRERASAFTAKADEKMKVSMNSAGNRAFLLVGNEDWPFPIPIVKRGAGWAFDANAGRQEMLFRRIGSNELDAIEICNGYVEAQHDYALKPREGFNIAQYAQRIISTPGTQDGLAWRNPDGTLGGTVGETIAKAIEQGYTNKAEPYHGYYFKMLKGQGPAAPMGQMDYVVQGAMIGGFALAAAPADYRVTGVKTFIVSQDGVVYQKDLGPETLKTFATMERFNPDKSWSPVSD